VGVLDKITTKEPLQWGFNGWIFYFILFYFTSTTKKKSHCYLITRCYQSVLSFLDSKGLQGEWLRAKTEIQNGDRMLFIPFRHGQAQEKSQCFYFSAEASSKSLSKRPAWGEAFQLLGMCLEGS
jgi:hypothetical protein